MRVGLIEVCWLECEVAQVSGRWGCDVSEKVRRLRRLRSVSNGLPLCL